MVAWIIKTLVTCVGRQQFSSAGGIGSKVLKTRIPIVALVYI